MKTKFQSRSQSERNDKGGNKKYVIGNRQTPIGPAGTGVWLTEVVGIDRTQPHMIGVRRRGNDILWVRDNDEGAQELIKDWNRMLEEEQRKRKMYEEHLREQRHGGR